MLACGQHGDHSLGIFDGFRERLGGACAVRHGFCNGLGVQIKRAHVVASLNQVTAHAAAHVSQSNESNLGHNSSSRNSAKIGLRSTASSG